MSKFAWILGIMTVASAVAQPARPARAQASTVALLAQRLPDVSFQEAPLDQVMNYVSDVTKLNVVVRWETLETSGIARDKPISMNLKNVRLSQVLWLIMNEAGGSDVKLAYRASGNLLILSTEEDLGKEMLTRVYDVTDLLVRVPRFTEAPRIDIQQASQGGGGGGGQNIFGGGGGGQEEEEDDQGTGQGGVDDERTQQLIDLITQAVEPDSWVQNGGRGTITAFQRNLVVRNNILVHQALGGAIREE